MSLKSIALLLVTAQTVATGRATYLDMAGEKPIFLVTSRLVEPAEREQILRADGKVAQLKDETPLRRVDRPDYVLVIEDAMLPDNLLKSVRAVTKRLREVGPGKPFDPKDPRNADLVAWIAPSALPSALSVAPEIRIATNHDLTLSAGGRQIVVRGDNDIEVPDDAFPSEAGSGSPRNRPAPLIRRAPTGRVSFPLSRVSNRVEIAMHTDVARYLDGQWKLAYDTMEKEGADLKAAFEEERSKRKRFDGGEIGQSFDQLSPEAKLWAERSLVNNWKIRGFDSPEAAQTWLKGTTVKNVRTIPYASFAGYDGGVQTIFHIGLLWP